MERRNGCIQEYKTWFVKTDASKNKRFSVWQKAFNNWDLKYGDGDMQIQSVSPTPSAVPSPTPDPNARCNSNKPPFPIENGHWIWDDQWIILCDSERGIGKVIFLYLSSVHIECETT